MNKKLRTALLLVLVVVVCLAVFSGCTVNRVNPWDIENSLDVVGKLVKAMHGWIGSHGWTVVVFTVFLKLIMLPLDIWQRYSTRKMSAKMQRMQPYIAEIDKRYGANSQKGAEEKQKLFKKHGYSMGSSCLPMIITMVVFFVMFGGLRSYSTYSSVQTFNNLAQTYYQTYAEKIVTIPTDHLHVEESEKATCAICESKRLFEEGYGSTYTVDASTPYTKELQAKIHSGISNITETYVNNSGDLYTAIDNLQRANEAEALKAVSLKYDQIEEGWLWINNIAQPDTWDSVMPAYDSVTNSFTSLVDMSGYDTDKDGKILYEKLRGAVLEGNGYGGDGSWNGLMILPILSIGLSFLSMFISQKMEKKNRPAQAQDQQQAATNKTMMIIMPLMMAYFGFIYTGAFAIYMVANYLISIITTVALHAPVEKMVQKNLAKTPDDTGKASYMR